MGLGKQSMMTLAQFWNQDTSCVVDPSTFNRGCCSGRWVKWYLYRFFFVNPATDSNFWKFEKRPQVVWGYVLLCLVYSGYLGNCKLDHHVVGMFSYLGNITCCYSGGRNRRWNWPFQTPRKCWCAPFLVICSNFVEVHVYPWYYPCLSMISMFIHV